MQYQVSLKAGEDWRIQQTAGRQFALLDTGVAPSVQVRLRRNSETLEEIRTAKRGFRARMDDDQFTHVELKSSVDCAIEISVTEVGIDFDFTEGATVNAVIQGLPLPVATTRGDTPGNVLYVSGVSINDTPAAAMAAQAPVTVTTAGVALAAANANRREIRFLNTGPNAVAIGPTGQTWANRAIVLEVGDMWIETKSANLAWAGVTGTGTASVGVQAVTV